jgi:CubicO group peptidase (beta-lactamase class C family)
LKKTATLAATSALALSRGAPAWAEEAADAAAGTLPRVDAVLRAAVSAQDVPGVVAMAATETGVVYEGVFGSRRIHEGPVMTRNTIFRVASMVKLITSVAALRLVEQGKLSLEAPVPDIDPVLAEPQSSMASIRPANQCCVRPSGRFRCMTSSPTPPASSTGCGTVRR